ncbi:hypothetical protein [Aeromonas simiae]|uniref:hypothetical protein n=1 Tax=Aeromonas simiae TaxID=218936 RepID=UPI00266D4222|nr:hypothetical protein [Aeromonas simiae]MDO2947769.1 hypothetical protein [Aeromonas simiae]MDO2952608.1 hypothetical protein [Aeromonas simiae]MDO2954984.1 hypothetical protein [Aeromonas simiae]
MKRVAYGLALLLALPLRAEVLVREVYDAPAMARTLSELYPDLGVSHLGGQLVVSGEPARLAEVKQTLEALNRPPLMLSVQWRVVGERSESGWQVGARHGLGVGAVSRTAQSQGEWQVSGLSGRPVSLTLGQTRPVTLYGWRGGRWVVLLEEREGIAATPTLVGDRVTVALSSRSATGMGAGTSLSSEVSGRPGEWIELGAISQDQQGRALGTAGGGQQAQTFNQRLQIRVTAR